MPIARYFLSDFVEIQRKSFFELLEKGLIEELNKRNPINSTKKDLELFFYPEYYLLTVPEYSPPQAILHSKSYTSKLYIPAQLTDKKSKTIKLKWVYIGNLPLMTKRGHFILNGAARVIVNQIIRSPGLYYQEKLYYNSQKKKDMEISEGINQATEIGLSQKFEGSYKRYYVDFICLRGTWLRLEIDKDKNIWAQMKKGPKIPAFWFLIAMGIPERIIFKTISEPNRLTKNLEFNSEFLEDLELTNILKEPKKKKKQDYKYVKNPPEAWKALTKLMSLTSSQISPIKVKPIESPFFSALSKPLASQETNNQLFSSGSVSLGIDRQVEFSNKRLLRQQDKSIYQSNRISPEELGRKWIFNKFMNPRTYDLGKQGRLAFNRKLGLNIDPMQVTLTAQDVLYATDYLIKVEKGLKKIDDIDHLKNRRVRTSGELIQIQLGIGFVRLEKSIKEKLNKLEVQLQFNPNPTGKSFKKPPFGSLDSSSGFFSKTKKPDSFFKESSALKKSNQSDAEILKIESRTGEEQKKTENNNGVSTKLVSKNQMVSSLPPSDGFSLKQTSYNSFGFKKNLSLKLSLNNLISNKPFNSAVREFFGTSPLSQFMDQINPLAEITHKRRLSSMGPGGVTRDTATLAIRGIHPTHYGRICPIETPEGKNTGLVNSMTTYARVNPQGIIESPFYKVYKGQVQKTAGMFFLSAEQEEKIKLAAADLFVSSIGFLPKADIPVRISEDFTKIPRNDVQYVGISPLQMISIATSLIPFLEHDDANRALMGSNMQRQAVPIGRPERPFVGTGLEGRAVSDSGHVIQAKFSGIITYVSADKIIVTTLLSLSNP